MSDDPRPRESKSENPMLFQPTMANFEKTVEEIQNVLKLFQSVEGHLSTTTKNQDSETQENLKALAAKLDKIESTIVIISGYNA